MRFVATHFRHSPMCALTLLGGLALGAPAARADFALRAGDRVVFYGDSITDQRQYTTLVETFVLTRFPRMPISFVHSGWGGDKVTGGNGGPIDLRLQRDVLPYQPTVMTIMLGMNDGYYKAFDAKLFDTYTTGIKRIIETVRRQSPNTRFTLLQPSPYDDVTRAPTTPDGYNSVLVRYGQAVQEMARQNKHGWADLNAPVVAMLQKANASDPILAAKLIPDRVHPGPGAHLIMAQALLQAWGAPSVVTDVEIDAAAKRVVRADSTQLASFQAGPPNNAPLPDPAPGTPAAPAPAPSSIVLSWTQLDNALPLPLDLSNPYVALAVGSSDVIEALDRQPLRITGLPPLQYTLKIDGVRVSEFSSEQLAAGINLATLYTPMRLQAAEVHKLTLKHNDQHFYRWRTIQVPLQAHSPDVQKTLPPLLRALDAEEAQTVTEQRRAAQPTAHRYELSVVQPPAPVSASVAAPRM